MYIDSIIIKVITLTSKLKMLKKRNKKLQDNTIEFLTPFTIDERELYSDETYKFMAPRLSVEVEILKFSVAIRSKNNWHIKMDDPKILSRWKMKH